MAADAPAIAASRIAEAFAHAAPLVGPLLAGVPYASVDDVMDRASALADSLSETDRVAVLASHPRLGASPAGLPPLSAREQGGTSDAATLRQLAELNDDYERRFGFRCVIFVAGRPKQALVPVMRERLAREREAELRTGLAEYLAIARDRLEH